MKRHLPSWMGSEKEKKSFGEDRDSSVQYGNRNRTKFKEFNGLTDEKDVDFPLPEDAFDVDGRSKGKHRADTNTPNLSFSKLLEGVIFVLSGFVNPERGILRSQALDMGAEYRADWTSDCTLLVCAFPHTPKFRKVESDCGTIVSKEWISECYRQKKLLEIEPYLMHLGRPWRISKISTETYQDQEDVSHQKHSDHNGTKLPQKVNEKPEEGFLKLSPSKLKEWAADDLNQTISWLKSQEETPEPSELRAVAAEGILTCLQDVLNALDKKQGIKNVTDQWKCVPRIVQVFADAENRRARKGSISKKLLLEQVVKCKNIYENEFRKLHESSTRIHEKPEGEKADDDEETEIISDTGFESDETVEITKEEITLLTKNLVSSETIKSKNRE